MLHGVDVHARYQAWLVASALPDVAGGGSLPRSHRRDACSSPNLADGIINKAHGIDKNRDIASVLYTSALTDDEITRVMQWLKNRWLT